MKKKKKNVEKWEDCHPFYKCGYRFSTECENSIQLHSIGQAQYFEGAFRSSKISFFLFSLRSLSSIIIARKERGQGTHDHFCAGQIHNTLLVTYSIDMGIVNNDPPTDIRAIHHINSDDNNHDQYRTNTLYILCRRAILISHIEQKRWSFLQNTFDSMVDGIKTNWFD